MNTRNRARTLLFGALLLAFGLSLLATNALGDPDPNQLPLPGGQGIARKPYRSPIFQVGGERIQLTLERPQDWHSQSDDFSFILEPDPNPGDLGFIAFLFPAQDTTSSFAHLDKPEGLARLLDGIVLDPTEQSREAFSLKTAQGQEIPGTLVRFDGQFENGQSAHLFAVHAIHNNIGVVVLTGASERAWGPYSEILREMLVSVTLNTAPAP